MTLKCLRRGTTLLSVVNSHLHSRVCSFSLRASTILGNENEATQSSLVKNKEITFANYDSRLHLSPLFSGGKAHLDGYKIELVHPETWQVSSGLAEAWRGTAGVLETKASFSEEADEVVNYVPPNKEDPDFDEIEDMRIRGNLFYKLDRDSKEFEEYSFEFHRRKSAKNDGDQTGSTKKENSNRNLASRVEKSSKNKDEQKESKKKGKSSYGSGSGRESLFRVDKHDHLTSLLHEVDRSCVGKQQRTPTFNQLTDPYHEPFCLDIYISKGSVRACIVHRATSKVVVVAHSISKDMKFDLASTKNATACAAVGEVLARRALADDIHNAVYTPRKGEKMEGKLQIVLQSIIDNGVNVKVKIKQRKSKKAGLPPTSQ